MNEFPRMLYRCGGPVSLQEGAFSTLIVDDGEQCDAATSDGWFLTPGDAKAAQDAADAARAAEAAQRAASDLAALENSPPTRAELEAKAAELGIRFDGRTSDRKLTDMIRVALEA